MDEGDPDIDGMISAVLEDETKKRNLNFHELRYRVSGSSLWVEVHLLFPKGVLLKEAHNSASEVEAAVSKRLPVSLNIVTHLEPLREHDELHRKTESPHH